MYAVIAHLDRVKIYTIHQDDVTPSQFSHHEIKGCTEIQFSHGGHLYAINDEDNNIQVFKFWQNERPAEWIFSGHQSPVRSICWLDDDTGFASVGQADHSVILWKLAPNEQGNRKQWVYRNPGTQFYDCQVREEEPDKGSNVPKIVVIAACRDEGGCIREIHDGRSRQKFETGSRYAQLKLMHGHKAFFAGIQSEGQAGSIQVIPYPFDRVEEEDHKLEDL